MVTPPNKQQPETDIDWETKRNQAIDHFLISLSSEMRTKLDYSPASLYLVGEWLINRYPKPESVLDEADKQLLDGVEYYIGETYRKNLEGHWNIRRVSSEPDYPDFDLLVIEFDDEDGEIVPAYRMMETLKEGIEPYLSQDLEALVRYYRRKYSK